MRTSDRGKNQCTLDSLELTGAVTALANALAYQLNIDEMALLASIFAQLGDTLATIAARENICQQINASKN
jgi:uncharacterized protein HemY